MAEETPTNHELYVRTHPCLGADERPAEQRVHVIQVAFQPGPVARTYAYAIEGTPPALGDIVEVPLSCPLDAAMYRRKHGLAENVEIRKQALVAGYGRDGYTGPLKRAHHV